MSGPSTSASASEPPARLGNYQLLRLIARGGMGEVHLAKLAGELGFEKILVVKTVRSELAADARFVELFAAEAKTAVGLNHPNIAPIYELGRADDGTLYAAMGWVDGPSLAQVIERQGAAGLELGPTLFIIRELLDGLAHAHAHDRGRAPVVHRDITPRNVLVDRSGRVQIIDFGIAKPARSEVAGIMGSVGYMAPEQARAQTVDPRADVFSVGCVFYELLTGRRAFTREGVWMLPEFSDLPESVRALIERCLALDPDTRYADAGQCLRALAPLLATHAPAFASRDLAELIVARFPEGWERAAEPDHPSGVTPATQAPRTAETFATRIPAVMDPTPGSLAGAEPVPGAAGGEHTQPNPQANHRVRRGLLVLGLLLALFVAFIGLQNRRELADPAERPPPTPAPAPAETLPVQPEPAPPPTVPTPVAIELELSPADTQVELDAQVLEGPPYTLTLEPGRPVVLRLSRPGYREQVLRLDPAAPPPSPLQLSLETLAEGRLSVLAPTVAWAEVWLDGTRLGTTPLTDSPVLEGRHKLEVRCTPAVCDAERELLTRTVKIKAGRTFKVVVP